MWERKFITIDEIQLAYTDVGIGQPVVMIHDFGTFSYTWYTMLDHLTVPRRYIALDLKGFGYSDKTDDIKYSTFHQARLLSDFINTLKLKNVILVGHSYGGAVCLFSILLEEIKKRVAGLVLINSMGYFKKLPQFIEKLRVPVITSETLVSLTNEMLTKDLIEQGYHDLSKIRKERIDEYAGALAIPGAKLSVFKGARHILDNDADYMHFRFNQIRVPTLILWGEQDRINSVYDAHRFYEDIPHSDLVLVPECGHFPQEECPEETAQYLTKFLNQHNVKRTWFTIDLKSWKRNRPFLNIKELHNWKEIAKANRFALIARFRGIKMRRLVDKWSLEVVFLFMVVKVLQVFRSLGLVAEVNGWRAAAQAYLRKEDSKFCLAIFRLDVWSDHVLQEGFSIENTEVHVIERLAEFLKKVPSSHWRIVWSRFSAKRARQGYIDIIKAQFHEDGRILSITPYFDVNSRKLRYLPDDLKKKINEVFIEKYNDTKDLSDKKRPLELRKRLLTWIVKENKFHIKVFIQAQQYIRRLTSGTFVSFERASDEKPAQKEGRFKDPDFIHRKHPGYGLLNILCRINKECDEADLWFQFHHVPVDGAPMQEVLQSLKDSWGVKGEVVFPSLKSEHLPVSRLSSTAKGKASTYHIRDFIDYRSFLNIRKDLNNEFAGQLLEGITAISMLIWGMAHHHVFAERKFLFTVDLSETEMVNGERRPGVVFIRPSIFFDKKDRFAGFLKYQREFNRRLHATRARTSESYELLELYALTSPVIYDLTRRLMPKALTEFIGTVGITMIRGADLFITPHSEIHTDGFIAFGNFSVPTEDGLSAGAVSIRGPQEKIELYLAAIKCVVGNFKDYL
ncbi:alpha/beta fold hydrolase [Candidatus Omnitrophota bacterium]